jgi:cytochrome c553
MRIALGVFCAAFAASGAARAADLEAGKARAEACAACHGANGVSVSADIPNLAGQKIDYLIAQLKAFREGKRANPYMNAIAAGLGDADIQNVAAYWNSLPGAEGSSMSEMAASINDTRVTFPEDYKNRFTYYTSINFPDKNQIRKYYANDAAVKAAKAGKPMPDGAYFFVEVYAAKLDGGKQPVKEENGSFAPGKLQFYTAMATGKGWGDAIPDLYRNGDWNYAVFAADGALKRDTNQAKCFACHKPLAKESYLFSLKQLKAAVK